LRLAILSLISLFATISSGGTYTIGRNGSSVSPALPALPRTGVHRRPRPRSRPYGRPQQTADPVGRPHPGDIRFGIGALAHLLKNRFYIGEVCYRGEVHNGEHDPILDRDLFEAVQKALAGNAVARRLRLKGSPAVLAGRLFDDRGNRMSPTHANKRGVRYRYYVSHALLQNRANEAGSVSRVSAPDVESIVVTGLRDCLGARDDFEHLKKLSDRELVERHIERIVVKPQAIELFLQGQVTADEVKQGEPDSIDEPQRNGATASLMALPWTAPSAIAVKGLLHAPSVPVRRTMPPDVRDALLTAIAKSRA
jgi:site-specific DNA recombinase